MSANPELFVFEEAFGGELMRRIQAEIDVIAKDLDDPNKKRTARELEVKLKFEHATAEGLGLSITAEVPPAKLAKRKPLAAMGILEVHPGGQPEIKEFPRPRPVDSNLALFPEQSEGEVS